MKIFPLVGKLLEENDVRMCLYFRMK